MISHRGADHLTGPHNIGAKDGEENRWITEGRQLTDESLKFVSVAVGVAINDPLESCCLQWVFHQLKQCDTNVKLTVVETVWNQYTTYSGWNSMKPIYNLQRYPFITKQLELYKKTFVTELNELKQCGRDTGFTPSLAAALM